MIGGVAGGAIAIAILVFFAWWMRRRIVKRRSSLLTPLSLEVPSNEYEKRPYVIKPGSIGPTPRSEKLKAVVGDKMNDFRGRMHALAAPVTRDRGNPQYTQAVSSHSRVNSLSVVAQEPSITTRDRFFDWWARVRANTSFNWRILKNGKDAAGVQRDPLPKERKPNAAANSGAQPDFLTLLGMDDRELDREALRRRMSGGRASGSTGSLGNLLGPLNFMGSHTLDDPFSDLHSIYSSSKPAPLVVNQAGNPFGDAYALREPPATTLKTATYVGDMRRSHGRFASEVALPPPLPPPPRVPSTIYGSSNSDDGRRESLVSVESFATRRTRFRSDPFDLERPELLARARAAALRSPAGSSMNVHIGSDTDSKRGSVESPAGAHMRSESFTSKYSSKYSSGLSFDEWSDPGPDVGPASTDGPEARESPTQGWRDRQEREAAAKKTAVRGSVRSGDSVGKAF